jgi:hypothetical protein
MEHQQNETPKDNGEFVKENDSVSSVTSLGGKTISSHNSPKSDIEDGANENVQPDENVEKPEREPELLTQELERKHYKDTLRVLLKSRCCTPSDLADLQQLRYVLILNQSTIR